MKIKGKQIDSLRVQKLFTELYVPGDQDDVTTVEYVKNYVSSQLDGIGNASGETQVENALDFTLDSDYYTESGEVTLKGPRTFTEALLSNKLSSISFKAKLDSQADFTTLSNVTNLNNWVTANIIDESSIYQVRVVGTYKSNSSGRASIALQYTRSVSNVIGGQDKVVDLGHYFNFDSELDTVSREIILQGFRNFTDFFFSNPLASATLMAKLDIETSFTTFNTLQDLENWQVLFVADETTLWQLKINVTYKSGFIDEASATLLEQVVISSPAAKAVTGTGWAQYGDTQYGSASPYRILAGTDTILPNNAGQVIDVELPALVNSFYDASSQKITPVKIGDGIGIRVSFKAVPTQNGTLMDLSLDTGGALGKVFEERELLHAASVAQPVSFTISPAYAMDTFFNNGGQIKINVDQDVDIYDVVYVISRYHESTSG